MFLLPLKRTSIIRGDEMSGAAPAVIPDMVVLISGILDAAVNGSTGVTGLRCFQLLRAVVHRLYCLTMS